MKNKTKVIIIVVLLVIILLFPVRHVYLDGGSKEYVSLFYKVIVWHRLDDYYNSGFKTGTNIYIFPFNFRSIDYYAEKDVHPTSLYLFYNDKMIKANTGSFEWCNSYKKCVKVLVLLTGDMDDYEYFEVSKGDKIDYLFNDGKITSIKYYKDSFENVVKFDNTFDEENIYAPKEKGRYVLEVKIKGEKGESNYYFGLIVK